MLYHHGGDYNVSASAAAAEAKLKLQGEIDRGLNRARAVLEQIDSQVPTDRIVKGSALRFAVEDNQVKVALPAISGGEIIEGFHRHAIGQAASRAEIPLAYIDKLMERSGFGPELVAHNLNKLYENADGSRYLTRSVNGQVRGFLSDSYRRLDSRPIVQQFIQGVQQFDAIPLDGYALETKIAIKAILPHVFEPVPNEVMVIGLALENSDFGNGALSLRTFVERLWCTNRAISTEDIRKIHLGARLGEDLQLSQRTYDLDTMTMASAAKDVVSRSLSPDNVNKFLDGIRVANETKVEARKVLDFAKKYLTKGEAKDVVEAFNSPEVEMLPAGQTTWRLSNAISWIANTKIESEERKLEVMKVAGLALDQAKVVEASAA